MHSSKLKAQGPFKEEKQAPGVDGQAQRSFVDLVRCVDISAATAATATTPASIAQAAKPLGPCNEEASSGSRLRAGSSTVAD